jgi:hypothetical protein
MRWMMAVCDGCFVGCGADCGLWDVRIDCGMLRLMWDVVVMGCDGCLWEVMVDCWSGGSVWDVMHDSWWWLTEGCYA